MHLTLCVLVHFFFHFFTNHFAFNWFENRDSECSTENDSHHFHPKIKISMISSCFPSHLSLVWNRSFLLVWNTSCVSVFPSFLWAVSYAVCLLPSQQCVQDAEQKEKRPSGPGHSVATTTRDAARTPLQTIITIRVGNNVNHSGNVPLFTYSRSLSFLSPPSPVLPAPFSSSIFLYTSWRSSTYMS